MKLSNGTATDNPSVREAMAYCEGRKAAADGETMVYASGVTGVVANNNALEWTAKVPGNGISIALIDPGIEEYALAVVVVGNQIHVYLETDVAGDIISTAAEVDAAIAAESAADDLVDCEDYDTSTGAGVVAVDSVVLAGGLAQHQVGEDADLFLAGFNSWTADPSGVVTRDNCAHAYGGGYS